MALVTVQRSPSVAGSPQCSNSDGEAEDDENSKNEKSECFFAGKDTAMVLALKDVPKYTERRLSTDSTRSTNSTQSNNSDIQQHLQSMFYLLRKDETLKMAVKLESQRPNRTRYLVIASCCCFRSAATDRKSKIIRNNSAKTSTTASTTAVAGTAPTAGASHTRQISLDNNPNNRTQQQQQLQGQLHNQSQTDPSECLEANEKHSSSWSTQCSNRQSLKCDPDKNSACGDSKCTDGIEESCLLGIDCNERTTIGLVVPILADTTIHLDGDGGFSVAVYGKTHIFKPVSVQAMWSALQTLHKVSQKARANNFYPGGPSHDWLYYHESRIESDQSCLNEWNAMDAIESRRPPSPDAIRNKPTAKEETESVIKMKLKEIMMSVDLDEVTSKYIRGRLEEHLDMDLGEYKSFIDAEIMVILGQMDAPTEIFEHVYLGSEWNASNLEELQKNGVRHILNVTREIDNFFPGMFDYFNVRVYDDEKTNLLKHWDNTFRYITRAKSEGSKVLVHCKMGVSRSASVVIAYAMKAYNWEFQTALQHVKERRSCIKPNKNFLNQLETYRGMLDAMKNKEKLQRSKSETNLKSTKDARLLPGSEPTPLIQALNQSKSKSAGHGVSGADVAAGIEVGSSSTVGAGSRGQRRLTRRSSSTSPKNIPNQTAIVMKQQSQSLENLTPERSHADEPKNVRFPGSNGENYSVTQNQVLHIQKNTPSPVLLQATQTTASSVRTIIHDLEAHKDKRKTNEERKALNLPFGRSVSQDPSAAENASDSGKSLGSPVWTSSAKLITQTSNLGEDPGLNAMPPALRSSLRARRNNESGIIFPAKLDEEKKRHSRKTQSWAASSSSTGGIVMDAPSNIRMEGGGIVMEGSGIMRATAKLGSNSSIDSAGSVSRTPQESVVRTRTRPRDPPLRHASWGSGDNRCGMPMRNSSWSSYDTNRNTFQYGSNPAATAIFEGQIHDLNMSNKTAIQNVATNPTTESTPAYHHGTVKRTKQKLEQSTALKKHCQENGEVVTVAQTDDPTTTNPSIKKSSNLCRSASAAGATKTHYPLRCNSEEFVTAPRQNVVLGRRSDGSRPLPNEIIAASAPEPYTLTDIENKNTLLLETDDETAGVVLRVSSQNALEVEANASEEQRVSGSVQILKKNFEAKSGTAPNVSAAQVQTLPTSATAKKGTHSLPSSPVAQHVDQHVVSSATATTTPTPNTYFEPPPSQANCTSSSSSSSSSVTDPSDRNVKGLVHKYQTTSTTTTSSATTVTPTATNTLAGSSYGQLKPRPRSCYENPHTHPQKPQIGKPTHEYSDRRPPQSPAKMAPPSNMPAAGDFLAGQQQQQQQQRRLQHGKTHPLARLSLPKQSFNAAAYNTM